MPKKVARRAAAGQNETLKRERPESSSDEEDEVSVTVKTKSQRSQRGTGTGRQAGNKSKLQRQKNNEDEDEDDFNLTQNAGYSSKQIVSQSLFYVLIANTKRHPIKRADITKNALTGVKLGPLAFKDLLMKIQKLLKSTFGILMYGLNESTHEYGLNLSVIGYNSFILVSEFNCITLPEKLSCSIVTHHNQAVQSVLFITLAILFMNSVDPTMGVKEEVIWRFVSNLRLDSMLGNMKEQDFKKFLKTELVQKQYLLVTETREEGVEGSLIRYFWGPRADIEFSKLDILLKIADLLDTPPQNFPDQCKFVLNSNERERAKRIFAEQAEAIGSEPNSGDERSQPASGVTEAQHSASQSLGSDKENDSSGTVLTGRPGRGGQGKRRIQSDRDEDTDPGIG